MPPAASSTNLDAVRWSLLARCSLAARKAPPKRSQIGTDVALGTFGALEKRFLGLGCIFFNFLRDLVLGIVKCLGRGAFSLLKLFSDFVLC